MYWCILMLFFYFSYTACQLLLKYLTDTPISPLPKEMVEIADPFCTEVRNKNYIEYFLVLIKNFNIINQ